MLREFLPCRRGLSRALGASGLAVLGLLGGSGASAEPPRNPQGLVTAQQGMTFRDGRLTVEVTDRPWAEFIKELEKRTGIAFNFVAPLEGKVTAGFRNLPVHEAVKRLFPPTASFVFVYEEEAGKSAADAAPSAVWVLLPGQTLPAGSVTTRAGKPGPEPAAQTGTSSDVEERLKQVQALAEKSEEAIPQLAKFLQDPEPRVRTEAAEALGDTGDDAALEPLRRAATTDVDTGVRTTAVEALGRLGTANALDPLRDAMRDRDASVRQSVVEAVLEIASEGEGVVPARALLREAARDQDPRVREAAAQALRELRQDQEEK